MDESPVTQNITGGEAKSAAPHLNEIALTAIHEGVTPAVSLAVYYHENLVIHAQWGWQNPETKRPLDADMLFDLASLTKLFTVTAFLRQVAVGKVSLDTPLAEVVPEFAAISPRPIVDSYDPINRKVIPMPPEYAGVHVEPEQVTFRQILTHTSGLPPWRRVYNIAGPPPPPPHLPDPMPREQRWARTFGALCALDFAGIIGDRVRYTDVGIMLLGEAVARLDGRGLYEAIREPLLPNGLRQLMFRPVASGAPYDMIVPTEDDPTWRKRRVWGEVHDENADGAGGIAGHAGLFGSALDIARFGLEWLHGAPNFGILPELAREAVREHAETDGMRRGLGWVMKAHEGANCGDLLSPDTFGHTGFTGTSLWIDPRRELVVALLTNSVYPGRDVPGTYELRRAVHTAIAEALL